MRSRLTVLAAVLALAAGSLAFARPDADAVKGVRAILVEGPVLDAPVRIDDLMQATGLHITLMQSMREGPLVASRRVEGRPCLRLGAFLARVDGGPPVETLEVEQADLTYWLYPAVHGAPATIYAGEAAFPTAFSGKWHAVSDAARTQLEKHGVPVSVEAAGKSACERPTSG